MQTNNDLENDNQTSIETKEEIENEHQESFRKRNPLMFIIYLLMALMIGFVLIILAIGRDNKSLQQQSNKKVSYNVINCESTISSIIAKYRVIIFRRNREEMLNRIINFGIRKML